MIDFSVPKISHIGVSNLVHLIYKLYCFSRTVVIVRKVPSR
jgi:hypothetical protein